MATCSDCGLVRKVINMDGQPRSTRYMYVSHWDSMLVGTWPGRIQTPMEVWASKGPKCNSRRGCGSAVGVIQQEFVGHVVISSLLQ